MGRGIVRIGIGLVLLVGGLSGKLVLRFTNSGYALAALGAVFLGFGVWGVVQARKAKP